MSTSMHKVLLHGNQVINPLTTRRNSSLQNPVLLYLFLLKTIESEDIVTKLVLFTIAIGGNTFFEPIVNIV